ncbi:MAG: hypothetical protein JO339_01200, partial [Alphaproteobacteria bacterium]|nr:hypothetical protein [Alphaproteobacteria bacterium]
MAEALEELERRDADFREEGIDEAGNEETDPHELPRVVRTSSGSASNLAGADMVRSGFRGFVSSELPENAGELSELDVATAVIA